METLTQSTIHSIKLQYDLHTRLFNNVLEGLTNNKSNERLSETVNHVKWIAGHMVSSRYGIAKMLDLPESDPYADLFGHGHGINLRVEYPELETLMRHWNVISKRIAEVMETLNEDQLEKEAGNTPVGDSSLGGYLSFLMHHEAYHLGQLGMMRKCLGFSPMDYR